MAKLNNDEYWAKRKRQAKRWIRENLKDDDAMQRKLLAEYQTAAKGIQDEINREYMSYAQRAGLDISDAMQAVSDEDVTEFAQEAAQMVADHDFSDEANARLKLYNATMRINRLEYLKSRIGLEMLKATANSEDMISRAVGQAYTDTTQREAGILQNYADHFDPARVINGTIKQYSPRGFSRNVWQNQDIIMSKLDQQLTQAMVRGLNPRRIAQELRPLVNQAGVSAAYAAERIARTETARAQNQAQLDSFEANDVDKVVWIAEPSACDICKVHDDQVFVRERVPELPAHPNCRCALAADPGWADVDDAIEDYLDLVQGKDDDVEYGPQSSHFGADQARYIAGLPAEERESLRYYSASGYIPINGQLRGFNDGMTGTDSGLWKHIANISKSLHHPIGENLRVYRALRSMPSDWLSQISKTDRELVASVAQRVQDKLEPDEIKLVNDRLSKLGSFRVRDAAFMSTSYNQYSTGVFGRNFLLELDMPEKTNAVAIESLSAYRSEKEILVNKGAKIKVVGMRVSDDGNTLIWKGRIENGQD
ncbi:ADP-ribosyltransferase [Lacticaseibacillus mingshuiensis]|uniref:ADP-ribosyltransferase n=1 Tax=Lacticaseibacillus mingshuiensis TaxID=2799574 RepID=UPI00194FFFF9|nr:ADP-ribosyltransferase [Lacticaseibacillus mingshuiensis]